MIMAQSSSTSSLNSSNAVVNVNVVDLNQTSNNNTATLPVVATSNSSASLTTSTTSITTTTATTTTAAITTTSITNSKTVTPPPSTSTTATTNNLLTNSDARWIFVTEKIENTPSRLDTISKEEELAERQQSALFISDLGSRLKVNQLCINTAIIYMHRFYMIHSLKKFHHYVRFVATACLFFACKVEEQPRRLKEFIDNVQYLLHKPNEPIIHSSEDYRRYGDEIMALESCLIQTLGFNVLINHAHTVIIKTCQMIKAPRDLAEAAYLTATNSLILTNFCVKFSSEKVACFCIYLACKWTGLRIPMSSEGMQWYEYVNHDIKEQELEDISKEYLTIYDKCSFKIKKKLGITKSQDETPMINKQQQYIKKPTPTMGPNPNASQQQISRQTNDPHHNNHQYHNVNIQKQFSNNNAKPGSQPGPVSSSSSSFNNPPNGFNSNSHYMSQQYQQRQQQQHHQHQRSASTTGPMHITNKQANTSLTSSSSSISSNFQTNNNIPVNQHNNLNKSLNLPSKSSSNMQTSSSNLNKSNLSNGNGAPHPSGTGVQSHSNSNLVNQTGATINNKNNLGNFSDVENINKTNNSNYQNNNLKRPIKMEQNLSSSSLSTNHKMNPTIKSSPTPGVTQQTTSLTPSMKRSNDETNNGATTMAPNNKIPKYVIDQKSAS